MKRAILGFVLLAASFSVSAKVTTEVCNACSDQTIRELAIDEGTGDHFFFDMTYRKLTHWSINLNPGRVLIVKSPISADQQKLFEATQNFYDTVGSLNAYGDTEISVASPQSMALIPQISTPLMPMAINGKVTAFDVVQTPVAKQAVLDNLTSRSFSGYTNVVRIALGYVLNALTNNAIVNVPIVVMNRATMPDGSSIVAKWNFQTGEYEYVVGSARDAVGNPIPEDSVAAAGGLNSRQTYYFPDTVRGQMSGISQVQRMNSLGIGVNVVTARGSWVIACVNFAGRTTCAASVR